MTNSVRTLQQLVGALQNQVNQPQQADHQKQVAERLKNLTAALSEAPSNTFPPTWKQLVEQLGAADLFGSALADTLQAIFSRNQITPSVALEETQALHARLTAFQGALDQILGGFEQLKIGADELQPGEAELGVLIPRDFVDNKLESFGKELDELNDILVTFAELATQSRPGFTIRSISSTDLSVFLDAIPAVAACVAVAVERIVALYKQLLKIRKLHSELRDQEVPDENLEGVAEHANSFMEKGIESLVGSLLDQFYKSSDKGRRNELSIGLRYSLTKIANRIDRGYNVEVRVAPVAAPEGEEETATEDPHVEMIMSAAPALQFLKREGKPILSLPESSEKKNGKKK